MKRLKISLRYALKNSGINCMKIKNYSLGLNAYYRFVLLCRQKMGFDVTSTYDMVDYLPFDLMYRETQSYIVGRYCQIKCLKAFFSSVHFNIVIKGDKKAYIR
jgi:hypothetical protein